MNLYLANPWGLLGLLAIPTIIAIHCFQRKSRPVLISTLFLMPKPQSESRAGRRWEFWRTSWAFWMQLLAAALLSLLLAQPRIIKSSSTSHVAIVLDASASMSAFRGATHSAVNRILSETDRLAASTKWLLRDSHPTSSRLYHGSDVGELRLSLEGWRPTHGAHSAESALRAAQVAVGREGRVIFVSDAPRPQLNALAEVVTVGQPLDNVGFTGVRSGQDGDKAIWQAMIRNYGATPQQRQWWIDTGAGQTEPQNLTIPPHGVRRVGGAFPNGVEAVTLRLQADEFTIDDTAPVVSPQMRPVAIQIRGDQAFAEWVRQVVDRMPGLRYGNIDGVTDVGVYELPTSDRLTSLPNPYAIAFAQQSADEGQLAAPKSFVESHPLVEGLTFNGLVIQRGDDLPLPPEDNATALVWAEDEPLIYLQESVQGRVLVFRFDPQLSNLDRLPAYVILINRYIADARSQRRSPWRENFETHQALPLPGLPPQPFTVTVGDGEAQPLETWTAPVEPTLFTVQDDGQDMLHGAARFADIREADFTQASEVFDLSTGNDATIQENLEDDLFTPLWGLLLIGALLANYHFTGRNA